MIKAIFTDDVNSVTVSGLTQWDYGQQLQITGLTLPDIAEVHFASMTLYAEAITRFTSKDTQSDGYIVDIPNECLREPHDIKAWVYVIDDNQGKTEKTIYMPVTKRSRPKDFVNPPDPAEETLLNEWIEKINDNIEDNATFKAEITASEEQRVTAEQSRATAEQERASAESARVLAENERDEAETTRIEAETARVQAETARQSAESARVTAEQGRVTAENGRAAAETDRDTTWQQLKTDIEQTLQSGVIKDDAPSASTTYSSNKIDSLIDGVSSEVETLEASIPAKTSSVLKTITIDTTDWSGSVYTLADSLVTETSNQEWLPPIATGDNSAEIEAVQKANIQDNGQSAGQAKIICMGDVPTITIHLRVIFRGDK